MIDFSTTLDPLVLLGLISAGLSILAYAPYIIDTLRRRTQPQRASWFIWTVLGSIALGSQVFEGATQSLWFAGAQVGGTVIVFLLSLAYGFGRLMNRLDFAVLFLAGCGLGVWYVTESAVYALAITISVSLLGGVMTVIKAYVAPHTETLSTWAVSLVASACAALSVGALDPVLLAYPVYVLVLNGGIVGAILLGKRRARGVPVSRGNRPEHENLALLQ